MFAFIALPAVMAIGGALVSVPIIIHLINRMRFRRVRWAAMEFLLKSQKRNRRRLIIEQIILLLLRCLLVVLAALLLSHFFHYVVMGFMWAVASLMGWNTNDLSIIGPKTSAHFVIVDDTLSMKDHWQDEKAGKPTNSFEEGKKSVLEIANKVVEAAAQQQFRVVKLSEPTTALFDEKLTVDGVHRLATVLADMKCTDLALSPQPALDAGKKHLNDAEAAQKYLHFVSDFRTHDWNGPTAEQIHGIIETLARQQTDVYFVDCSSPVRNEKTNEASGQHDNIGIVEIRPDTRIAAVGMPVQVTVVVQNFTNTQKKDVVLTVKVDGAEVQVPGRTIPELPPNSVKEHTFQATFTTKGFKQLSVSLPREQVGLEEDNKRFAVIDVRDHVDVLIVDGGGQAGKSGSDTYYLQTVFTSARGYQVVAGGVEMLDRGNLEQYPSIYLLNVADIRSERALKNLEDYVRGGGSVCFFLGDKVRPSFYNEALYKKGQGIFPVPLADRANYTKLTEQEKEKKRREEQQKMFILANPKDETGQTPIHSVFNDVYAYQDWIFPAMIIEGYWPTLSRDQWENKAGSEATVLMVLPNEKPLEGFKDRANALIKELEVDDPALVKFKPALERHQRLLRGALSGTQLYDLAVALKNLLDDEGASDNPVDRPNLKENFWKLEQTQALRKRLDTFRQEVQYGDPLVVSRPAGKGKVWAFLTTAGRGWHDWAGGSPAQVTYPIVMLELEKHLSNSGEDVNLIVGNPLRVDVDASRYEAKAKCFFLTETPDQGPAAPGGAPRNLLDRGEVQGVTKDNRLIFAYNEAHEPGVYQLELVPKQDTAPAAPGGKARTEPRLYAFNVDTPAEGDLKRAGKKDLGLSTTEQEKDTNRGKVKIFTTKSDFDVLRQKQNDTTESPWVFLLILIVLVGEQALAVHLSFHLKASSTPLPTQFQTPGAAA